jgi:hypothetical protein
MNIYIKRPVGGAWQWILKGYAHAWLYHKIKPVFFDNFEEIKTSDYHLMIMDSDINDESIKYVEKSFKSIIFTSAKNFPEPWGSHPNFTCVLNDETIYKLNSFKNVLKWTFCDTDDRYFSHWKNIKKIPLAFDSINYYQAKKTINYEYDVCFIGGHANNGFNEKIILLQSILNDFHDSGLKCAFSVGNNVSHDVENEILSKSKICLNIHDKYQRELGLDTNERTFKSLGINGMLISDSVADINNLFPDIYCSNSNKDLIEKCKHLLSQDLEEIKNKIRVDINKNHSYINRVNTMICE